MIEVLKQALKAFEVATTPLAKDRQEVLEAVKALNQAIAELESQELKQVTVKDFVHMVEGKEDLIGRPVCFAQWPNGNTNPPQPEQKTSADDFFKTIADKNPKPFPPKRTWVGLTDEELAEFSDMKLGSYDLCLEVEAKLKEKNL